MLSWVVSLAVAGLGCIQSPPLPTPEPNLTTAIPSPVPQPVLPPVTASNPWEPDAPARDWQYIVIHHTASEKGSVETIHEQHLGKGWEGIGYHFLIGNGNGMPDGEIEPTFRWREQMHGAHAGVNEYNQQGIGICLVGNFEESHPTPAQLAEVKRLVGILKTAYDIGSDRVIGHQEVKATACPGKHFPLADVAYATPGVLFGKRRSHTPPIRLARFEENLPR